MTTSRTEQGPTGRAHVVGVGLIGGSIGMALRALGWSVTGSDLDATALADAVELGAIDRIGGDEDIAAAELVFVATPVSATPGEVRRVLAMPGRPEHAVVTDVGGVKRPIVDALDAPGFVGGHPMAGSERAGVRGASAELFAGATWVLTPTGVTEPVGYARLRSVLGELGADVVELTPQGHDELVAVVSHVPHLTAATLMNLAAHDARRHVALLRLAAGGFRDMTRVAAGQPDLWPEICRDNSDAIVATMDRLIGDLGKVRDVVAAGDRSALVGVLTDASRARRALGRVAPAHGPLVELRLPVSDRPGTLAEVTTLAAERGVNILDVEIVHALEGGKGVLALLVAREDAGAFAAALGGLGYRVAAEPIE